MADMARRTTKPSALPEWLRRVGLTRVLRNRLAVVGMVGCLILLLVSTLGPLIIPQHPTAQDIVARLTAPSAEHLLGTDSYGRDMLSRIVWATRISVTISILSILLGAAIGTVIGVVAGYKGGWIDTLSTELVNVFMAFPTEVLGILVLIAIGAGEKSLIVALGIAFSPRFIRLARAETMSVKSLQYIEAARACGASDLRIMVRHVLPNITGTIVVTSALWTATAIRAEAGLSFLGLGVQPPWPSWGNLIAEGLESILDAPWLTLYPSLAILIAVLSINMLGDGLRDWLDPKSKRMG